MKKNRKHVDIFGLDVTIAKRGTAWQLDYRLDGKRVRKQVATAEEREKMLGELKLKMKNLAEAQLHEARHGGAVALTRLTETTRIAILNAWQKIEAAGGKPDDLSLAVERYVASVLNVRQSMTLAAAVTAYAESRPSRRERTVMDIQWRLKRFTDHFGAETSLADIEGAAVEAWLRDTLGAKARSFNLYRQHLRGMFKFAVAKKWILVSPVEDIAADTEEHDVPVTLSPAEVKRLLSKAVEKYPELVPYLVLGVFAGLRPERELGCLKWSAVDLENARLTVTSESSKHRRARNVPLSDNALAWLRRFAPTHSADTVFSSRRKMRGLLKAAGVTWGQDILRHSYGSYLLAQCEDMAIVAARMGNSPEMVKTHYNSARNAKEAAAFWAITPPESGIVKFPKVEAA